jgi:hypothetical protein
MHGLQLKNLDRVGRASAPAYIGVSYKIPIGIKADLTAES